MRDDPELTIARQAVLILPAQVRDNYLGVAVLKLRELDEGMSESQKVAAMRTYVQHAYKTDAAGYVTRHECERRVTVSLNDVDAESMLDPGCGVGAEMEREEILAKLPADMRRVAEMLENGYTVREIAVEMGLTRMGVQRLIEMMRIMLRGFRPRGKDDGNCDGNDGAGGLAIQSLAA